MKNKTSWGWLLFIILISTLLYSIINAYSVYIFREISFLEYPQVKKRVIIKEVDDVIEEPTPTKTIKLKASWYQNNCCGRSECTMANGDFFDDSKMTAAFNLAPLGEIIRVKYKDKLIYVEVTDRINKRYGNSRIDLSKSAFEELENLGEGLISVEVLRN